jgi:hypothetical protein
MNMTNVQENPGTQRTRRNILKAAPILASAVALSLATTRNALAKDKDKDKDKNKDAMCFLKGTKIQTAKGERKVEDLAIGDLLPTMFGGLRPVQWIGRYQSGGVIRRSCGSRTRCRFASPAPLSLPMSPIPISM